MKTNGELYIPFGCVYMHVCMIVLCTYIQDGQDGRDQALSIPGSTFCRCGLVRGHGPSWVRCFASACCLWAWHDMNVLRCTYICTYLPMLCTYVDTTLAMTIGKLPATASVWGLV